MTISRNVRVAYLIDPRFPGGTSAAVAQELTVTSKMARVSVHAAAGRMFKGQYVSPRLKVAMATRNLSLAWDEPLISADVVVIHNPSFLKLQHETCPKIVARHLIVVTHENFLRPCGDEAFDVARCLNLIDRSSVALRKSIAPISRHNRATVKDWMFQRRIPGWTVLENNWFNVCDFEVIDPGMLPKDRRGRHSRSGFEKFPGIADMDACFPKYADANIILGADIFLNEKLHRPHWKMLPFANIDLKGYFEAIDFMIYFTAPTYRESFGRVIAETIAAGKVIITDPETASGFNDAAIGASPTEVDQIVARFVGNPESYREQVITAQHKLRDFSGDAFRVFFDDILHFRAGISA